VLTFEPMPKMFFNKNLKNFRISNLQQKIDNLKNLNVDFLIIKKFDRKFSKIKSITFIKEILGKKLKPKFIFEEDIIKILNKRNLSFFEKPNRLVIGGCDKKTKLQIINTLAQVIKIGYIILIPIIDIQTIKELREELEDKNFKTNLNLIQTYKSLSIAEGLRLEPNNPVFILKGKKIFR